jgi:hypothetical protein
MWDFEVHLIALGCSEPPAGFARWSSRLLVDKVVGLNHGNLEKRSRNKTIGMILAIDLRPIPSDIVSMDELAQRADMQLSVIETAYSIRIQNKEEIVSLLSKKLQDKRQIFLVCTSISSWIAGSNIRGDTVVPINIVLQLIEAASHSS